MKRCNKCEAVKPYAEFHKRSDGKTKDGYRATCKKCRKGTCKPDPRKDRIEYHLVRKYGLTLAAWHNMLDAQGGACALCGTVEPNGNGFHVDHDHKTGKVRALLCMECNTGLGKFKDDKELLLKAVAYLNLHGE